VELDVTRVVCRLSELEHAGARGFTIAGADWPLRGLVVRVGDAVYGYVNRCPHAGAPLDKAACVARLTSPEPGVYQRSRVGELLRCPWHGWEFDMRNGQSWFDPKRVKVRSYPVKVESGGELAKGPYVAETFPVHVEDAYVIVEA